MNTSLIGSWSLARLAEVPWELGLAGRWTALLIVAWMAHIVRARRNPRWRVLVWRSTAVGLATIAVVSAAPPVVVWQVPYDEPILATAPILDTPAKVPGPSDELHNASQPKRTAQNHAGSPRIAAVEAPSTAVSAPASKNVRVTLASLGSWLVVIWLAGMVVMTSRLGLSVWGLSRIIRRSRDVPAWVVEECRAVAAALGCRQAVRFVQTAEVPTPCLTGLFQPWLLLPEANCEETDRADLRAILAHEFAHACRHDLVWNVVLHFWSILLWFHPLVWRMRAAHLAACDAVCDALAADLVGDVASYGRTLARLALQVAGPTPAHGLAMARTPDVFLRIESLQRRVFRGALPWRLIVPALLALGAVVFLIGGIGITGSDQPPARKATEADLTVANAAPGKDATNPASRHRLSLRVLSAKTGEPLDGVSVSSQIRGEGKNREETVTTGKEGTAAIEWPAGITLHSLWLDVKKSGYVAVGFHWSDRSHALSLPETQEVRLELGVPMGGVVQDEDGKPIAGASVTARSSASVIEESQYSYVLGTTKTDEQGRWRIDDAPANLSDVSLHVHHPDYQWLPGATRGGREWRTILSKGTTVTGRILDGSGKPVPGAKVAIGDQFGSQREPVATDERGAYTLRNCDAGPTIVTAQAEGFAPELREVRVPSRGELEAPAIQLGKASRLRVRVVDWAGKPVVGAYVAADTWRGYRSLRIRLQTDAAGRITWTSAPSDAVLFDIFKDGYMRKRLIPLTASNQEQLVTIDPELVISGSVSDAATGKPVPRFRVVQGVEQLEWRQGLWWENMSAVEYTAGRYSTKFDFPMKAAYVRVEAPGYEPAESRAFRSDEGAMIQDFRLKPAAWITGVVLLPNGKPASGVKVALGTREHCVFVRGGMMKRDTDAEIVTTGPDGQFTFPPRAGPFVLGAVADAGFADASSDEFAKTGKLVLQPWGRIEGELRIGQKPAAHQSLSYAPLQRFRTAD